VVEVSAGGVDVVGAPPVAVPPLALVPSPAVVGDDEVSCVPLAVPDPSIARFVARADGEIGSVVDVETWPSDTECFTVVVVVAVPRASPRWE
jgi:hypothetical protein